MKKIICIHLLNDYSGSPFILSQTIQSLQKNSYIVELFTNDTEGFLSNLDVKKYNVFYKRSNYKIFVLLYYLYSQMNLFFKLLKYKNEDTVFYINTMMPFGAGLAGKLLGIEVIYHIHETSIRPNILKKFLLKVIEFTSSKNIYVSKFLAKTEPIKNVQQYTIYNALPKSFTDKANRHKYNPCMNFNVLMICSLKEYKGILEFLELARLCKDVKFDLVLNASTEDIDLYFKNIKKLNNITIFPSQKNLHPFYEKASLVLNLSRIDQWQETFGMTILEAMSYAIPCIVPPIGGPIEIVDDNINGYTISSYEVNDIAKKITDLNNNNRNQLNKLSINARLKSKQFKQEIFSNEILKVVNEKN